jgi:hypothetical protein
VADQPTNRPTDQPTNRPTDQPTNRPTETETETTVRMTRRMLLKQQQQSLDVQGTLQNMQRY